MNEVYARKKLNSFKVGVLKTLCEEYGLSQTGKKMELMDRLISLEKAKGLDLRPCKGAKGKTPATVADTASDAATGHVVTSEKGLEATPTPCRGRGRPRKSQQGAASKRTAEVVAQRAAACVGLTPKTKDVSRQCVRCACCGQSVSLPKGAGYTQREPFRCPPCRFVEMDPFSPFTEKGLLHCTAVTSCSVRTSFSTPGLREWKKLGYGVEVRMVKYDCSKNSHAWPKTLKCIVNGSEAFSIARPDEGHKRRDVPRQIIQNLKNGQNDIHIAIDDAGYMNFALAIVLTKHCTDDQLAAQVQQLAYPKAIARVRKFLMRDGSKDADDIVCQSKVFLPLTCPLTMERLVTPVRGSQCQHLQCFSLQAYLQSNRQMQAFNNRWKCPCCSLVVYPADLVHDAYVSYAEQTSKGTDELLLMPDGSWKGANESAQSGSASSSTEAEIELLDDDCDDGKNADADEDEDDKLPLQRLLQNAVPVPSPSGKRKLRPLAVECPPAKKGNKRNSPTSPVSTHFEREVISIDIDD